MMTQGCQKVKEAGFARYHARAGGGPPRPTLLAALKAFGPSGQADAPVAVDLGCGTGRDTLELLRRGWRVLAVDRDPGALEALRGRAAAARLRAPETLAADFSTVALPPCDLVNASFCLFLCPPARFSRLWRRILEALRPDGRFAGQLLGPRDGWAGRPGITIHDEAALDALLAGLAVERRLEEEADTVTPRGNAKHWHLWHVVARQPPSGSEQLSASRA
ncbi:class I SAM-dependent methyltransferase [Geminicoccaceae bacterium 1502E]|nr:class I SAM-dependent methyltransferase [Geminicoccaceae bacterium 1502E]